MQLIISLLRQHGLEMLSALHETGIMVILGLLASVIIGLPLGTLLFITRKDGLLPCNWLAQIINAFVNIIRSFPYLLFVFFLIPFTRKVFGTAFGVFPASVPIMFVGIALYARYVETAFLDVEQPIIERGVSMGASLFQIIWHFVLPQALNNLILSLTSLTISIISYSSVMGIVGGGGIGDYAYRYGYQEYNYPLMYIIVFILILIVLSIQLTGHTIARKLDHRKG